jgi:hypothetical protein
MTRPGAVLWTLVALALAAFGVLSLSEGRRALARQGALENDLAAARARAGQLEQELAAVVAQNQTLTAAVERAAERAKVAVTERAEQARKALQPMPEGVRQVLVALNRCLAADGHENLRAIGARSLRERKLFDLELIEQERESLRSTLYLVRETTCALDRERGMLTIEMRGGDVVRGGERQAVAETGLTIVLPAVYGPMWERELGAIVSASGEYPEPRRPRPVVDRTTVETWRGRVNRLLAASSDEPHWRLDQLNAVEAGGVLRDVLLLGYSGRRLVGSIEAARMTFVADAESRTVHVVLHEGEQRVEGGVTRLPEGGYRLLLGGVRPELAEECLTGLLGKQ